MTDGAEFDDGIDAGHHDCGMIFHRGDLVWCRTDEGHWQRGVVTDVFRAPVTRREVIVVHGSGYYEDDVVPDTGSRERP